VFILSTEKNAETLKSYSKENEQFVYAQLYHTTI